MATRKKKNTDAPTEEHVTTDHAPDGERTGKTDDTGATEQVELRVSESTIALVNAGLSYFGMTLNGPPDATPTQLLREECDPLPITLRAEATPSGKPKLVIESANTKPKHFSQLKNGYDVDMIVAWLRQVFDIETIREREAERKVYARERSRELCSRIEEQYPEAPWTVEPSDFASDKVSIALKSPLILSDKQLGTLAHLMHEIGAYKRPEPAKTIAAIAESSPALPVGF